MAEAWADGKDGEVAAKWRSFETGGGVTIGTLYHEAEKCGWRPPWRTVATGRRPPITLSPNLPIGRDLAPTDEPAHLADDALAEPLHGPAPTPKPSAKPMTGWSAAELLAANFPEPTWAVPGFVPVGLTSAWQRQPCVWAPRHRQDLHRHRHGCLCCNRGPLARIA